MVPATVLTPVTSSSNVTKILPVNQDAGMLAYILYLYIVTDSVIVRKRDIADWGLTTAALMFVSLDAIPRLNVTLGLDRNGQRSPIAHLTCAALNLFVNPI